MLTYPKITDACESRWAWRDRMGWTGPIYGVIHATASPGATAYDVFKYFCGPNAGACSHFVIGKAGDVYQCADPNWAAAANCCPSKPSPFVDYFHGVNANFGTWSIEILKNDSNNQDILPEAQFQAVVDVSKWLCDICHTKRVWCSDISGGIASHSFLDPVNRPNNNDPGPFAWDRYFNALKGVNSQYMEQQMRDTWALFCEGMGRPVPSYASGIAASWKANYARFNAGSPLGPEKRSVDWGGRSIQIQWFSGGYRCEWDNQTNVPTWYDCFNKEVQF